MLDRRDCGHSFPHNTDDNVLPASEATRRNLWRCAENQNIDMYMTTVGKSNNILPYIIIRRVYYLVLVDHTSKRALIVVDSWKISSSSQTADIPESTDLHGKDEKYI